MPPQGGCDMLLCEAPLVGFILHFDVILLAHKS